MEGRVEGDARLLGAVLHRAICSEDPVDERARVRVEYT